MSPPRCWNNHSLRSQIASESYIKNRIAQNPLHSRGYRCECIGRSEEPLWEGITLFIQCHKGSSLSF